MLLARLARMPNRLVRIAVVLVVSALAAQGCIYGKKRGPGTNLGSGYDGEEQLPPPGQPTFTLQDDER